MIRTALLLSLAACTHDPRSDQVDRIMDHLSNGPGCAVVVVQEGRVLHQKGYGLADLGRREPIQPTTRFRIASMSKQFTAYAITLLAEEGQLTFTDRIDQHLPELAHLGPIQINHLLHHTSGIPDYGEILGVLALVSTATITEKEVLSLLTQVDTLGFVPGTAYAYSNSNYFLLAEIVQRITKEPLARYAERKIFSPLGMKQTEFVMAGRPPKNVATGHQDHKKPLPPDNLIAGDGGVITTALDLLHWDAHFYTQPEPTSVRLTDGTPINYGLGLVSSKHRGLQLVAHAGGYAGFKSQLLRYPERRLSVICLCNTWGIRVGEVAGNIAKVYSTDLPAQPPATELSETQLGWVGSYRSPQTGAIYRIDLRGTDPYFSDPFHTVPLEAAGDILRTKEAIFTKRLQVVQDRLTIETEGAAATIEAHRFTPWEPTPSALRTYVGRYRHPKLPLDFSATVSPGGLTVTIHGRDGGQIQAEIVPTLPGHFSFPNGEIEFTADGTAILRDPSALGLRLNKIQ